MKRGVTKTIVLVNRESAIRLNRWESACYWRDIMRGWGGSEESHYRI